ncbi:uncharacterized protein [Anabrus simplex]|uniref:uncharacterized protein n=1 Tax=Anabrus simplex TaxID=316456 RepID=UPI0035A36D5D
MWVISLQLSDNCFRCVVIHEKHTNVLQYKETYCYDRFENLANMCNQITGDATLFSMFRSDAEPAQCPFKGGAPFTFTYNRGSGECVNPVSRVDSCTDDSRLLLSYQACPDVYGTESAVEELVCLAAWKDGSTRYLVGKLHHSMAHTDEDRYRCFVFERISSTGVDTHTRYNVAQSGDATCNGLLSATEGSRTMRLTKVDNHGQRCQYPSWVTEHHQWHTLDHALTFHFSKKNATLRITGRAEGEMRVVCHSIESSLPERQEMVVAHVTTGCQSGYACIVFYRRDGHVIELQQSATRTRVPEEACQPQNFNPLALPYITLITNAPHLRDCPYLGRYNVTNALGRHSNGPRSSGMSTRDGFQPCSEQPQYQFQILAVGCSARDTMEFHSTCNSEADSKYSCHGSWEDNGTSYLIASPVSRKSVGARRFCFIYTDTSIGSAMGLDEDRRPSLQVASVTESCHRNVGPTAAAWTFNLTPYGQCSELASGSASLWLPSVLVLAAISALLNTR